jgi:hypothetical protein
VEIFTDSKPEAEEDDKILFPNLYADIDERAIGTADNTTRGLRKLVGFVPKRFVGITIVDGYRVI